MAAEMAVASPLLDDISVEGATGVLINIVGGPDLKMKEIQEAASLVQEQAHEDANIIFGASIDETLGENVKVTVIATGFDMAELGTVHETQMMNAMSRLGQQPQAMGTVQSRPAPQSMRVPVSSEVAAIASRRAAHAQEARASQPPPVPSSRVPGRERAAASSNSFPSGYDVDWDVPAFQRKQQ